jgi:predicted dinucleotide-binding enzyme
MKKIGIIGSGNVGKALAKGFIKYGYEVMIGSRDKSKLDEWNGKLESKVNTGSFAEAAGFGEIIVLAVKGSAAKEAMELGGANNLKGKTIIDTTNPIAAEPPVNGVLKYFSDINHSLMEDLQTAFPEAHFVKAFNSIGNAYMVNPDFAGIKPSMFICGNNEEAKTEVGSILDLFGFEVEDMGTAEAARAIEPLCMLWCIPGITKKSSAIAFKLLKMK